MQEDLDSRLLGHLHHQVLDGFGIHGRSDAGATVHDGAVDLVEAAHHLLADALADLFASFDNVPDHQQDQASGPQPAEMSVAFDESHVGTGPLGRDRRRDSRRSAANDQHVGLVQDGQFSLRLNHFAVHQRGTRSVGGHLARIQYAALETTRLADARCVRGERFARSPTAANPETPSHRNQSRRFMGTAIKTLLIKVNCPGHSGSHNLDYSLRKPSVGSNRAAQCGKMPPSRPMQRAISNPCSTTAGDTRPDIIRSAAGNRVSSPRQQNRKHNAYDGTREAQARAIPARPSAVRGSLRQPTALKTAISLVRSNTAVSIVLTMPTAPMMQRHRGTQPG